MEENKKKNLPTFSSLEEGRRETNEKEGNKLPFGDEKNKTGRKSPRRGVSFVSLLFFIPTFFFFLWKKQRQTKPKENEKVGKKKENDTKGERNFVSLRPSSREEKVPEGEGKKKGNEKKSWEKKLKENEEIKRNNHNGAFF